MAAVIVVAKFRSQDPFFCAFAASCRGHLFVENGEILVVVTSHTQIPSYRGFDGGLKLRSKKLAQKESQQHGGSRRDEREMPWHHHYHHHYFLVLHQIRMNDDFLL